MPITETEVQQTYPLHWLVWKNDFQELDRALQSATVEDIEKICPRGRTPLMLAVTLGYLESTKVLLKHRASVNVENKSGWSVVQEAVCTGDPELLQVILSARDFQRQNFRVSGIPNLLNKLKEAPDFYVEMTWEFTSWVPLLSRICPSDTYKIYKSGSNVRIDTTLLGFDQTTWQKGNKTFLFKGNDSNPHIIEIDHDSHEVYIQKMRVMSDDLNGTGASEEIVTARLTAPVVINYIDIEKINFERNKSGLWGWRSDRNEIVMNHDCKVYTATNIELVTKTRSEHVTSPEKLKEHMGKFSSFHNFLGIAESEEKQKIGDLDGEYSNASQMASSVTLEEYFDPEVVLGDRDIGRPKEQNTKVQKFKANLWLCEDYPLSLQEQIMPIVDIMSITSTHFAKLKEFIQLQLPSGFPVKIEIPLFHVLNAKITFGNIFGLDSEINGVNRMEDDRLYCSIDGSVFEPPASYTVYRNDERRPMSIDEEDELLQFAIQQSLLEAGSEKDEVDIWEALKSQKPSRPVTPNFVSEEERSLQKAIEESLNLSYSQCEISSVDLRRNSSEFIGDCSTLDSSNIPVEDEATQLHRAISLSQREQEEFQRLLQEEDEEIERIIKLSLVEK